MSSSNYFRYWINRPHLDPNTRLLTEEYQRGITEFMGTSEPQPAVRLEEPIRTDVDYGVDRGVRTDAFGVTSVNSRRKLQYYDPFILASQADQVCRYIKYPMVRNKDDPWVTVTRLNPRGRVQGSSELEDQLQPSTSSNLSAAEDLAGVGLVVDLTDFGEETVVHVDDESVIGEFHQDPDSDSSGDDDSETD
ncbi:hypothetical protein F2Q69_00015468 [Brassica cretica]|uniref:DUF4216 domain-containing protein n=1 Tax=Brassica cretica TaxID=69181 RepID=A0A8S9R1E9_BRACR|nr:hypothetical protein F2Q69_00015468 [Brassica cretica]